MNKLITIVLILVVTLTGTFGQCSKPNQFKVNGKCGYVSCRNNGHCQNYKSFCGKPKDMSCLSSVETGAYICKCRGEWKGDRYGNSGGCNYNLNGNRKCAKGHICNPSGHCVKGGPCIRIGGTCPVAKKRCCEGWCQRGLDGNSTCQKWALPGENCTSGIRCKGSSQCINGKCSKRRSDACGHGDVCPDGTKCMETNVGNDVYKNCAPI